MVVVKVIVISVLSKWTMRKLFSVGLIKLLIPLNVLILEPKFIIGYARTFTLALSVLYVCENFVDVDVHFEI